MSTVLNFDATGVDITNHFDALPAGEYVVIITDSVKRATKAGDGEYLELTLEVQGDHFRGRKLWDRLNLWNPSAKAVEIAQRQLAQIAHAVGVLQVPTAEVLHHKPLVAIVRVRDGQNGPQNEVKGYKGLGQAPVAQAASNPVAPRAGGVATTPPPRAAATPPWAAKA
jgi:hypothetical protein